MSAADLLAKNAEARAEVLRRVRAVGATVAGVRADEDELVEARDVVLRRHVARLEEALLGERDRDDEERRHGQEQQHQHPGDPHQRTAQAAPGPVRPRWADPLERATGELESAIQPGALGAARS